MGYVLNKRTFLLKFEDYEGLSFEGLEVRCRSTSINRYYELIELTGGGEFKDRRTHRRALAEGFAEVLVSWNLLNEVDGERQEVPATAEGLLDQEEFFLVELFGAWIKAVTTVPVPLARPSVDGEQSEAPLIRTESLSDNLESLLVPS